MYAVAWSGRCSTFDGTFELGFGETVLIWLGGFELEPEDIWEGIKGECCFR